MSAEPAEVKQLCTFFVAGLLFGVDVIHVQEVIRYQAMTPVPLAPKVVSGLINLRGRIVTALDLRERLGLPRRPADQLPTNVVVRHAEGILSLLVDEIGDVLDVDADSFEMPPDTLTPAARAMIDGVYKLKPQLLLLLNTERAVGVETHGNRERNDHDQQ
jgi:purine-binding chemotaxis protein CheW